MIKRITDKPVVIGSANYSFSVKEYGSINNYIAVCNDDDYYIVFNAELRNNKLKTKPICLYDLATDRYYYADRFLRKYSFAIAMIARHLQDNGYLYNYIA